jgi:uncharacterized phiE125 gp8 family phage protein
MAANDLTTLAAVETFLGLPSGNADEGLLSSLITAASSAIESYCQRSFIAQAYNEYRDGVLGQNQIVTLGYPIISVTGVTVNGQPIPAAVAGAWPRSGYSNGQWYIRVDGYCIPQGGKNVNLQYTAGYATIPADLAQACVELVALKYKQKDWIGKSGSESIDGQSVTYRDIAMSQSTMMMLNPYKRVIQVQQ